MLAKSVLKELRSIVGAEYLKTAPEELTLYGYDATPQAPFALPDAVVFPATTTEIAEIVKRANAQRFPVIPRGAGTNLTGGARAIHGGVIISTQRLNRILLIDEHNLQAIVQPGVVTSDLQERVARLGLFYPPDPQSKETCTLGGNLAENAGGPRAVKYGVTRHYVLALEAVLPRGEIVRLGARTLKSVAGYDLVSLLVGSEGTLGVITEATLRLIPAPEARKTLLVVFGELQAAATAIGAIIRAKVVPAAIEFLDHEAIRCVEEYQPVGLPTDAAAVLVIEVDGASSEVERAARRVEEIVRAYGARSVRISADEQEAELLWKARRVAGPALARIAPHKFNEDIVVPIARLPEAIGGVHELAKRHRVACACFGHAGDGNIHVNFLVHPDDADERRRVEDAVRETFELAVALQGSITGEHGVGTTKQPYLGLELSAVALETMRRIKAALDPNDILNPGKIFPRLGV
jgi:glycolate oxidase